MPENKVLPFIVVVDDSPDDVLLLQQRFVAAGIDNPVCAFSDGKSAIEFLTRTCVLGRTPRGSKPCLLLLDINMPRMSGLELLKWARTQPALERVTIGLVSDSQAPADIERGFEFGADRYLVKYPVPEVLAQLVADAMQRLRGD